MKIAILGYSGAGKSTLAQTLSARFGLPVLHLDRVHWAENWTERDDAEKQRLALDFMDKNSDGGWVIDGNYSNLLRARRLEEADQIILLLFNRFSSLCRVTKRYFRYRGHSRPDMGEGCTEKLDAAFVYWVLWRGRSRKKRQSYAMILAQYPEKTVVLRNQRQLDRFLRHTNEVRAASPERGGGTARPTQAP